MSKALQGVTALVETTAGPMTFEFFPDKAPGHVENFVKLAEKGLTVWSVSAATSALTVARRGASTIVDRALSSGLFSPAMWVRVGRQAKR